MTNDFNLFDLMDQMAEEKEASTNDAVVEEKTVTAKEPVVEEKNTDVDANTDVNASTVETKAVTAESTANEPLEFEDEAVSEEEKALDEAEAALNEKMALSKGAKAAVSSTQKKAASVTKTDETPFEPTLGTVIRYLGESIPLTNYIDADKIMNFAEEKFNLEDVRKKLEKDYPELVASHTELIFIKKKDATFIVPTLKAKKKGNVQACTTSTDVATSLPCFLLEEFLTVARLFLQFSLEIHGDIYYDYATKEYFLDIPPQEVHPYFCADIEDTELKRDRLGMDATKVAEIHSHHLMLPLPSATDDMAERVPNMTYIIVGKLDQFYPQITARKFISDAEGWQSLNVSSLFERPKVALPKRYHIENIQIVGNEDEEHE